MRELSKFIWFMMGGIQTNLMAKYDWYALIFIPLWFAIDKILYKLYKYKPVQRRLDDYNNLGKR